MRRTAVAVAVTSLIIAGCTERGSAEARLTPVASWSGPGLRVQDESRWCDTVDAADSSCALGPAYLATVAASGRVFVSDGPRIVALEGRTPVRTISRQGDGPGEVRGPEAMRVDGAGNLHVFDIRRMRYLIFGDTGLVADVAAMPPMTMLGLRFGDSGLHVLSVPSAAAAGDSVTAYVIRRSAADTAWADTVARFPERAFFTNGGEGLFPPPLPWDRKLLWDVCGQGDVVVAASDEWRVTRYRRGAVPVVSVRLDVRARPVTQADRDSLLAVRSAKAPPPAYRARLAARVADPGSHPVIDDLRCSEDGAAYVRNTPAHGAKDAQWEVLGENGERTAAFTLPLAFRVLDVRGSRLVGVEEVDGGAEAIVTKRLQRADTPAAR